MKTQTRRLRGSEEELPSLPGQIRYSPDTLVKGIDIALNAGIHSFLLFGIPETKDENGTGAYAENGVVQQALRNVKKAFGKDVFLTTDVCLCESAVAVFRAGADILITYFAKEPAAAIKKGDIG